MKMVRGKSNHDRDGDGDDDDHEYDAETEIGMQRDRDHDFVVNDMGDDYHDHDEDEEDGHNDRENDNRRSVDIRRPQDPQRMSSNSDQARLLHLSAVSSSSFSQNSKIGKWIAYMRQKLYQSLICSSILSEIRHQGSESSDGALWSIGQLETKRRRSS